MITNIANVISIVTGSINIIFDIYIAIWLYKQYKNK